MTENACEGGWPGCTGQNAEYIANPYEQDVHGNIVMMWLCASCYQELCWDI